MTLCYNPTPQQVLETAGLEPRQPLLEAVREIRNMTTHSLATDAPTLAELAAIVSALSKPHRRQST